VTPAAPGAARRTAPAWLVSSLLIVLLLSGCGQKVRLETPDGSVALEYSCGGTGAAPAHARTRAEKALVRGTALRVIRRADRMREFDQARRLTRIFETGHEADLERRVVSYLCANGAADAPADVAVFPDSGTVAPGLTLPRLSADGRVGRTDSVRLADYRGRWVLVSIFGTWCEPCRAEYPAMLRLARRFQGRDFAILGVLYQDTPAAAAAWLRSNGGLAYPIGVAAGDVGDRYRVSGVPELVLVDPAGRVAGFCVGCQYSWMGPDSLGVHLDSLVS